MKIYTCTPVRFRGDHTFFSRDSGLCCRGLQAVGIESRAIMPGPAMEGDEPDLIRTDAACLKSADWWRRLGIDGLMFYSWGDGRYTAIARAIKAAGIRLMVNMDTEGLFSPRINPKAFWTITCGKAVRRHGAILGMPAAAVRMAAGLLAWRHDLPRIAHLGQADAIAAISPIAAERIKQFLRSYGRDDLAARVYMIPHPVAPYLRFDGTKKRACIICVGRWDDTVQKNPALAIATLSHVLSRKPGSEAVVIGSGRAVIDRLIERAGIDRSRIRVLEKLKHTELVAHYQYAQISLCSSHYESGHIVSEEALCCGCSVVAPDQPALPSMKYYISKASGQLGGSTPETLGAALCEELEQWERGGRDAGDISGHWCGQLHADSIGRQIASSLGLD